MTTTADIRAALHRIVRAHGASSGELPKDTTLGSNGLGLDSIAIAEVLLDCERTFGASFTDLLEGEPITLGRLLARAEQNSAP